MANYDSIYTGQEVDEAITTARSFSHTPVEIDAAIDTLDQITATPAQIDNAAFTIEYYPVPSRVGDSVDFTEAVNSTPAEIDATVAKVDDITATPTEINNSARILLDNSATNGQVLTADGAGACAWQTPAATPSLYRHTIRFKKVGDNVSTWSCEWIDDQNASSSSAVFALSYLSTWYRNVNCPKMISGEYFNNGVSAQVDGFYFDSANSKYVLVSAEQELAEEKFDNFNDWTFAQSTVQII